MNEIKKIVVFDTETSGLCAGENVILSLSWQVLNADLEKVAEESRFFDWPKDKSRIQEKAIEVNGLTEERLAELGTCDKREALQDRSWFHSGRGIGSQRGHQPEQADVRYNASDD